LITQILFFSQINRLCGLEFKITKLKININYIRKSNRISGLNNIHYNFIHSINTSLYFL